MTVYLPILCVRLIVHRWVVGQTPLGMFQNILPWEPGSIGRYLSIHFGQTRLEVIFGAKS